MTRAVLAAVTAATMTLTSAGAFAQAQFSGTATGGAQAAPPSAARTTMRQPHTLFRLFGVPVRVNAPVNSPYNDSSLRTFAGQPELGRDAVVSGTVGGP